MTALVDTRNALHRLARFVLAAELEGTTDLVTLRVTPGGFGQPERLVDGLQRRARVDGTNLVIQRGEAEQWHPITTLTAAAIEVGATLPDDAVDPDDPLPIDADAARLLAGCFATAELALAELRRRHTAELPTIVQLFPHHFDVAVTVHPADSTNVNVGCSPGDGDHDEPYLYVGPWELPPHALWNEPWGASSPCTAATTAEEALAFFEAGLTAARKASTPA